MFTALRFFRNTTIASSIPSWAIAQRNIYLGAISRNFKLFTPTLHRNQGKTVAFIQQVVSDIKKSENENYPQYRTRSIQEFCQNVPQELKGSTKDILVIHVVQTVDTSPQNKIGQNYYSGHIMSFLANFLDDNFSIVPGSVISKRPKIMPQLSNAKVPACFDTDNEMYEHKFVTSYTTHEKHGSRNFIVLIDLGSTIITREQMLKNIAALKTSNIDYQRMDSACSQAVMQAYGLPSKPRQPTQFVLLEVVQIFKEPSCRESLKEMLDKMEVTLHPREVWEKHQNACDHTKQPQSPKFGGL